jgi:mycothiol synthase
MNSMAGTDVQVPPGFVARPIDPDADSQAITDLCNAAAVAEYGTPNATVQMVRESYNLPSFEPRTDGHVVIDPLGRVAAVGEFYDNDAEHVAPFVYIRVRPDLLESGIGAGLLAWAERRGEANLPLAAPDLRVALHTNVPGVNSAMQQFVEAGGWKLERIYWTMEIELGEEAPTMPPIPEPITFRTAVPDQDEPAVYEADREAFADHYGFVPRTYDNWLQFITKFNPYDPSLWFLAMDGDQIAGISLCRPEAAGRPEMGWVSELGVRPPWRGKGLGLALLKHSFAEFHARGKRQVGLGVDSQSLTGATRLYERAGMHAARDEREYERVLREGRDIRKTS